MLPPSSLGLVAAWFVAGMARMAFTSKMVEHRIDNPDPATAMSITPSARSRRLDLANYDPRGRRLLPWYRAVNVAYWTLAAGMCWWAIQNI